MRRVGSFALPLFAGVDAVGGAECGAGYCGPAEVCVAGLALNADFTDDAECASGLCYRFSATERVCTDRVVLSRTDPACEDLR